MINLRQLLPANKDASPPPRHAFHPSIRLPILSYPAPHPARFQQQPPPLASRSSGSPRLSPSPPTAAASATETGETSLFSDFADDDDGHGGRGHQHGADSHQSWLGLDASLGGVLAFDARPVDSSKGWGAFADDLVIVDEEDGGENENNRLFEDEVRPSYDQVGVLGRASSSSTSYPSASTRRTPPASSPRHPPPRATGDFSPPSNDSALLIDLTPSDPPTPPHRSIALSLHPPATREPALLRPSLQNLLGSIESRTLHLQHETSSTIPRAPMPSPSSANRPPGGASGFDAVSRLREAMRRARGETEPEQEVRRSPLDAVTQALERASTSREVVRDWLTDTIPASPASPASLPLPSPPPPPPVGGSSPRSGSFRSSTSDHVALKRRSPIIHHPNDTRSARGFPPPSSSPRRQRSPSPPPSRPSPPPSSPPAELESDEGPLPSEAESPPTPPPRITNAFARPRPTLTPPPPSPRTSRAEPQQPTSALLAFIASHPTPSSNGPAADRLSYSLSHSTTSRRSLERSRILGAEEDVGLPAAIGDPGPSHSSTSNASTSFRSSSTSRKGKERESTAATTTTPPLSPVIARPTFAGTSPSRGIGGRFGRFGPKKSTDSPPHQRQSTTPPAVEEEEDHLMGTAAHEQPRIHSRPRPSSSTAAGGTGVSVSPAASPTSSSFVGSIVDLPRRRRPLRNFDDDGDKVTGPSSLPVLPATPSRHQQQSTSPVHSPSSSFRRRNPLPAATPVSSSPNTASPSLAAVQSPTHHDDADADVSQDDEDDVISTSLVSSSDSEAAQIHLEVSHRRSHMFLSPEKRPPAESPPAPPRRVAAEPWSTSTLLAGETETPVKLKEREREPPTPRAPGGWGWTPGGGKKGVRFSAGKSGLSVEQRGEEQVQQGESGLSAGEEEEEEEEESPVWRVRRRKKRQEQDETSTSLVVAEAQSERVEAIPILILPQHGPPPPPAPANISTAPTGPSTPLRSTSASHLPAHVLPSPTPSTASPGKRRLTALRAQLARASIDDKRAMGELARARGKWAEVQWTTVSATTTVVERERRGTTTMQERANGWCGKVFWTLGLTWIGWTLLQSLLAHLSPPPHLSPFYPALYAPAFGEPAFFDDSSFLAFASSFPGDDTAAGGKTQRRRGGGGLWSVFQPNYNHGGVAMDGGDGGWEGEDRPPEVPPPWRG